MFELDRSFWQEVFSCPRFTLILPSVGFYAGEEVSGIIRKDGSAVAHGRYGPDKLQPDEYRPSLCPKGWDHI